MTRYPDEPGNTPEQKLIDYYQSQQLSNDRLHAILDDTQSTRRKRVIGLALAASFVLMSAVALVHQNILTTERTDVVLREAALNHYSKLQMDAEGQSLVELQNKLQELPFDIKLPESEFFQQLALVGGRYCTISGNLAAHIKLSNPETSEQYSLFLTPAADVVQTLESPEVEIFGVDVRLWQENDLVYAFATAAGESS